MVGSCDNSLDERAAEGTFFEGIDACNRGTCGGADHGAEVAGALAGLFHEFNAAFDGAKRKLECHIAGEAFDEFKNVGGSTARKSGHCIHQGFCNAAGHADFAENLFGDGERFCFTSSCKDPL